MRKATAIFFLVYYSLGTVLFPMGDMSYLKDLPQMYSHCATEDPDINACDFVFEHLLNIHDEDDADEEHDKPHQAIYSHAPVQVAATVNIRFKPIPAVTPVLWYDKASFPLMPGDNYRIGFLTDVFRPPAIA